MSRALFRHCRDADATGQIGMKSDYKIVIAIIDLPMNHKTRQILRPMQETLRYRSEAMTTNLNGTSTRYTLTKLTKNKTPTQCLTTTLNEHHQDNTITNNDHDPNEYRPPKKHKQNHQQKDTMCDKKITYMMFLCFELVSVLLNIIVALKL